MLQKPNSKRVHQGLREKAIGGGRPKDQDFCKENGHLAHLVWILVFDDQHDHLDYYYLLVVLDIVQRMQSGLGLRQSGDPDDQHLKQDN